MSAQEHATAIIRDTETSLRRLVAEAASTGDYAAVVTIASWARVVGDLTKSISHDREVTKPDRSSPTSSYDTRSGRTQKTATQGKYPRFIRRDDHLIRIAWSKRGKGEYQQKAEYKPLQTLVEAIINSGGDGRIFSTDHLLPVLDENGDEIPNYKAYVCLSWMKHMGLLDQHGRRGYSIPRINELRASVESVWRALPAT